MKNKILLTCLLLVIIGNALAAKHALIVAIGNYEKANNQWSNLSCLNDVPLIMTFLRQNKFTDTVILRDKQATKQGIIDAAEKILARSTPGDIVVFHFSTHGQLIDAEKGDESDGEDEAIVAWGAPAFADSTYKGEKHLTHNEIKYIRNKFRQRLGPTGDLLFFFDACYSGGLTRGIGRVRGGNPSINGRYWNQYITQAKAWASAPSATASDLSPYVAISACRSDEKNAEDSKHNCGSLSYAISKAFLNARPNQTYENLFASINNAMYEINKFQHPVMDGSINRSIFGGKIEPKDNHLIITDVDDNKKKIIINTGLIHGITTGSILEAYPAGEGKNTGKELFSLLVTNAKLTISEVALVDTSIPQLARTAYWLYVKEIAMNGYDLKVSFDSIISNNQLKNELVAIYKKDTTIRLAAKEPNVFVGYNDASKKLKVIDANSGKLIKEIDNTQADLKDFLVLYAQNCALRNLDVDNEEFKISLDLKNNQGNNLVDTTNNKGTIILTDGETIKVTIKNQQNRTLYVNLLYFEADGTYSAVRPYDKKLEAYQSFSLSPVAGEPYGYGMFMCLATPEPMHLDDCIAIAKDRARSIDRGTPKGLSSNIQKIFANPTKKTRSLNPSNESGYCLRQYFIINPKK